MSMRYAPTSRRQPGRNPRLWPRPARRYGSGTVGFLANASGVPFLQEIPAFAALYPNARLYVGMAFGASLSADPTTWSFTDVSADVQQAGGEMVDIDPMGGVDELGRIPPAGCGFVLDNRSGAYSYGPQSSNWPNIKIDIPTIVAVNLTGYPVDTSVRFYGYAWSMRPEWDTTGDYAVVRVRAAGRIRGLDSGTTPLKSALERSITAVTSTAPREYWRLDDAASSTSMGSAVVNGQTMAVTGTPTLHSVTGPDGDPSSFPELVSASTYLGSLTATSLDMVGATGWTIEGWVRAEKVSVADAQCVLATWHTDGGTYGALDWLIYAARIGSSEGLVLVVDHTALAATSLSYNGSSVSIMNGNWHQFRVTAQQNSGSVTVTWWVDGAQRDSDPNDATWPTLGAPKDIRLGDPGGSVTGLYPISNTASLALADVAVYASSSATDHYSAGTGHSGELTTTRFARLCTQVGVPYDITGTSATTMGPESTGTLVDLLRECASADLGMFGDGRGPGVYLVTNAARYNQDVALTLDVAANEPSGPVRPEGDDQGIFNQYTVSRTNGSSATYADETGPLGTAAIGTRDSTPGGPLNLETDAPLPLVAGALVAIGTVRGYRYPSVPFDLRRIPGKAPAWLAFNLANRLQVTNVTGWAAQHPPETVDVLALGWSETLSRFFWHVTANCKRADPYNVGALDSTLRLDSAASTVGTDADASATSLSVATASGHPLPTTTATYPADFPFDVELGTGERVTVTAIVGASSPQTFTVTRAVNGIAKPAPAGTTVKLWRPYGLAL